MSYFAFSVQNVLFTDFRITHLIFTFKIEKWFQADPKKKIKLNIYQFINSKVIPFDSFEEKIL